MKPGFLRWLLPLAGLSYSMPAAASKTFPPQVEAFYGIDSLPVAGDGCRLCHRDDVGGLNTIATPFGRALVGQGAAASNVPSLLAALRANESAGTDSDGDGAADAVELRAGEDPNAGNGSAAMSVPLPETGCSSAHRSAPAPVVGLSALAACVLVRARRRQQRPPRRR